MKLLIQEKTNNILVLLNDSTIWSMPCVREEKKRAIEEARHFCSGFKYCHGLLTEDESIDVQEELY